MGCAHQVRRPNGACSVCGKPLYEYVHGVPVCKAPSSEAPKPINCPPEEGLGGAESGHGNINVPM